MYKNEKAVASGRLLQPFLMERNEARESGSDGNH